MSQRSVFEEIPGIGESLAKDLTRLGYQTIAELKDQNPEEMYARLQQLCGVHIDRCVLYTFRCAVYYADGGREEQKLKWWNWKDTP